MTAYPFFEIMIIIINENHNPAFNLAAEEYLIKNAKESIFMLWRNSPAVIVGVNQSTPAEISREYCEKNGISVIRRLTGGGAVYHDLGNVNYTYIEKNEGDKFANYKRFTKDIIDYLATFGLKAELSGRNDVLLFGKKIMGNAQCVKGDNIMHHGCILYSTDLTVLQKALKVDKAKINGKGIKSVSGRVTNIAEHIKDKMPVETFIKGLETFMIKRYNCKVREFKSAEIDAINELKSNKYSTFSWNYGTSPEYTYHNKEKFPFGIVNVAFNVKNGCICDIKIHGDFFGSMPIELLEEKLIGVEHSGEKIYAALKETDVDLFIKGCSISDLIKLFV
ncbi:MAG: lipoate--protein ligase [Clostridia bacterium]|nr:lipoate--protein ligase [Clostridia bacterium]